ncbi:hypothetical protein J4449_00635 [Candidatus Woesearchaeota archaeon]|nr:hypothetical protein [Candidatus Woesearchaeota archaeon]
MKCSLCNEKIETGILEKIKGTYVKNKLVCSNCQKKFKDKLTEQIRT